MKQIVSRYKNASQSVRFFSNAIHTDMSHMRKIYETSSFFQKTKETLTYEANIRNFAIHTLVLVLHQVLGCHQHDEHRSLQGN
jgi:hypothetical protein